MISLLWHYDKANQTIQSYQTSQILPEGLHTKISTPVFLLQLPNHFLRLLLCAFIYRILIKISRTKEIENFSQLSNFNCFYFLTNHYKYFLIYIKIVNFNDKTAESISCPNIKIYIILPNIPRTYFASINIFLMYLLLIVWKEEILEEGKT